MMMATYTLSIIDKLFGTWTQPFSTPMTARAHGIMEKAHANQFRKTGEPFSTHPTAVALRCFRLYHDQELVTLALLHDIVEDAPAWDISSIEQQFSARIAFMVDGLTKTSLHLAQDSQLCFPSYHHKLLWVGMEDIRVLLVKLADREHNLQTITALTTDRQLHILLETIAFYLPLAHLLSVAAHTTLDGLRTHLFQTLLEHGILTPSGVHEHLTQQGIAQLCSLLSLPSSTSLAELSAYVSHCSAKEQESICHTLRTYCAHHPLLP